MRVGYAMENSQEITKYEQSSDHKTMMWFFLSSLIRGGGFDASKSVCFQYELMLTEQKQK